MNPPSRWKGITVKVCSWSLPQFVSNMTESARIATHQYQWWKPSYVRTSIYVPTYVHTVYPLVCSITHFLTLGTSMLNMAGYPWPGQTDKVRPLFVIHIQKSGPIGTCTVPEAFLVPLYNSTHASTPSARLPAACWEVNSGAWSHTGNKSPVMHFLLKHVCKH